MMNSFAPLPYGILQLPNPRHNESSQLVGDSYFHKLIHETNKTAQEVRESWEALSEDQRQGLRALAEVWYNLDSPQSSGMRDWFFNLGFRIRMALAVMRGQQDLLLEAALATYRLMGAVMDAVELEEQEGRKATIYLANDLTVELPFSEVEAYLEANSEKVEPRFIQTRGARRQ